MDWFGATLKPASFLTSELRCCFLYCFPLRNSYDLLFQGAPEVIQDRLIEIPPSYVETYKMYTRQGSRVLALAYKSLADMTVSILWVFHYFMNLSPLYIPL